jgi:hypothetical protein
MGDVKVNSNSENKIEKTDFSSATKDNSVSARGEVKVEARVEEHKNTIVGERNYSASVKQFELNASLRTFANFQLSGGANRDYAPTAPTAAEAAAILKDENNFHTSVERANEFAATVYNHRGDAAYMEELFRELGPELSARLVADTVKVEDPTLYDQNGDAQRFDARRTVAEGLGQAAGALPAAWTTSFIEAGTDNFGKAMMTAQILKEIPAAAGANLHEAFLTAVMTPGRALNSPTGDGQDSWMYARAAGEILGANPDLAREYLGTSGTLTDAQRGQFIENGARFGTEGRNLYPVWGPIDASWDGFDKAISNLPPADLQNILEKNAAPIKTYLDRLGSESYSKDNPALGNLLRTAANITDADGNSTPQALQLFFDAIPNIDGNRTAREGAGAFFIEHAKQIVDVATGYGGTNGDGIKMNNLKTFFAQVYFAPDAPDLKFRDAAGTEQPLTDAIKTALTDVRAEILNQARDASLSDDPNRRDRETSFAGFELASLTGIVTDGLIEAAQTFKTEFERNTTFQENVVDLALDTIGFGAEKAGVPSEVTGRVKAVLLDFVKNRLDDGLESKQTAFQAIYDEIKFAVRSEVVQFSRDNNLNDDLLGAYLLGVTEYQTSFSNKARLE